MNEVLSISILSFNRLEIFRENLLHLLEQVKKHNIAVYISDDSDNDDVEIFIKEISKKYRNVFYARNKPGLGHDKNYIHSLRLPSSDYVWLLGDSVKLEDGAIQKVLEVIDQSKSDIIAVNAENRHVHNPSKLYLNAESIFTQFAWHLTYTGTTIFSRNVIEFSSSVRMSCFKNFPQIAAIFSYLSKNCSFYWVNDDLLDTSARKQSYWFRDTFKTFIYDWENAIYSLPSCYDLQSKRKVILDHSNKSKIFKLRSLLKLRSFGAFDRKTLKAFKSHLVIHSNINYLILLSIAVFPPVIIEKIASLYSSFVNLIYSNND